MSLFKKHRLVIFGLIFGALIATVDHHLDPWELPYNIYSVIQSYLVSFSFLPWLGERALHAWWYTKHVTEQAFREDPFIYSKLHPWFETWWKYKLPATTLYWGLLSFLIEKLLSAGRKRAAVRVTFMLTAQVIFVGMLLEFLA